MEITRVSVAKALLGAAMVGTLSLSGVVAASAGSMSTVVAGTLAGQLTTAAPEIVLGAQDSVMVTVPDGTRAYVANGPGGKITAYDLLSGAVVTEIPLSGRVTAMTASRDGSMIIAGSQGPENVVAFISTTTNTVLKTVAVPNIGYTIAESADGTFMMLSESSPKALHVIDAASGTIATTIPLPSDREAKAVWSNSRDGLAYISRTLMTTPSTSESEILVLDVGTGQTVRTIDPCDIASWMAFTPDGATAYIACGEGRVAVADTVTGSIVNTIELGFQASFAQLNSGGSRLIVAGNMHRTVGEIDTSTNTLLSTAAAGGEVGRLAASFDGDRVWFIQRNDDGSTVLTSLAVGNSGSQTPTPLPPTTQPPAVVPSSVAPTTAAQTTDAPSPDAQPSASDVEGLANTGAETVVPMLAVGLLLLGAGSAGLSRRKTAR